MNSLAGQMRSAMLLIGSGILAAALTGCGAPRVHEVYRLSALEAQQAEPRQALSPMQQDLRRMTLQAQTMQPRLRASAPTIETVAALDPGNVHECAPGLLAQYDGVSSFGPIAQVDWLGSRPTTLAFSLDGEL